MIASRNTDRITVRPEVEFVICVAIAANSATTPKASQHKFDRKIQAWMLPIPGSARARSIAAHRRVEELRIMGAGDSPVNEVRQNSGNSTIAFER
jgi:hypothetical protein